MRRQNRNRHNSGELQTYQAQSDLSMGLAGSFIAITALLLLVIGLIVIPPEKEPLKITVTWDTCLKGERTPGMSKADIDTWVLRQGFDHLGNKEREILGYLTPDRKTENLLLDQDDKGFSPSKPSKGVEELNREVIKSNKQSLADGYYYVNLHMFSDDGELTKQGKVCADVQVVLFKGSRGKEKVVCNLKAKEETAAEIVSNRQELTVCQFEVKNGQYVLNSEKHLVQNLFLKEGKRMARRSRSYP